MANKDVKKDEKMVTVKLYMGDLPQNKLPVEVWVNGEHFVVPRGKPVEVPDYVAAVLDDCENARVEIQRFDETNKPE
ncbi:MAG: hypothetical protein IKS52_04555 [Clostridia bacterium]|nr:hypothetical protein [Clostridia bacterium]